MRTYIHTYSTCNACIPSLGGKTGGVFIRCVWDLEMGTASGCRLGPGGGDDPDACFDEWSHEDTPCNIFPTTIIRRSARSWVQLHGLAGPAAAPYLAFSLFVFADFITKCFLMIRIRKTKLRNSAAAVERGMGFRRASLKSTTS
jgi:hypothetical protein